MIYEWTTLRKLSSQYGYYKCKLRRINTSIMNYQSLAQAWKNLGLNRFYLKEMIEGLEKSLTAV